MSVEESKRLFRGIFLFAMPAIFFVLALHGCRTSAQSSALAPAKISLLPEAGGFSRPIGIVHAGDGSGRLFIVEQGGRVRIVKNGTVLPGPFLDISSRLGSSAGEQGLLGVAFPPGYGPARPYVYTNFTGTGGTAGDTVIASFQTTSNPDIADPASLQVLLTVSQPFANHNGGQMAFGPDGYLYIGLGDGGSGGDPLNNAQNPSILLGKLLRIDVSASSGTYAIPPENPFVGSASYRPEIWALGLRNPWRFSFDRETGDLLIADVGQNSYEEVNVQPAGMGGQNYGWNIMEGLHCYNAAACDMSGLTLPVAAYDHSRGECSVTGGYMYRGTLYPALKGVYLYGDYCSGRIWGLSKIGGTVTSRLLLESGLNISTFGEDEAGNLYVADHTGGTIYRVSVP